MSCLNRSPTYPSTRPTPTWPPVATIAAVVVAVVCRRRSRRCRRRRTCEPRRRLQVSPRTLDVVCTHVH